MDSPKSHFQNLRYTQVASPQGRMLALEDRPAIYSWYRNLSFGDSINSGEKFRLKIDEWLEAKLSTDFIGKLGYLYEIQICEFPGNLGNKKKEILNTISNNSESRRRLASILESATLLQSPLYTGKTKNLRRRIDEHVSGDSGLRTRIETSKILLSSCILRFRYFDEEDLQILSSPLTSPDKNEEESIDAAIQLIEELLTRLGPSAFVKRPG